MADVITLCEIVLEAIIIVMIFVRMAGGLFLEVKDLIYELLRRMA